MKVPFLTSSLVLFGTSLVVSAQGAADSTISNDILAIDAAVRNLTATLTAYQGGIRESAPVTAGILNVHAVNRRGFADAQSSPSLNLAQSRRVVDVTRNSVGKSIPESIQLTKAKKPLFDQAELTSLVEAALKLLQNDHDTFSLAVGSKLDPSTTVEAGIAAGKIAASIADGTLYYAV